MWIVLWVLVFEFKREEVFGNEGRDCGFAKVGCLVKMSLEGSLFGSQNRDGWIFFAPHEPFGFGGGTIKACATITAVAKALCSCLSDFGGRDGTRGDRSKDGFGSIRTETQSIILSVGVREYLAKYLLTITDKYN